MIEIDDRLRVELFAAEPLIADPVAMEIDEDGNIFVVEDHGYPQYRPLASAVKLLRDSDGDGRIDESIVFADSLVSPRGIMKWKDGVIVTDAPDILYLEDVDGDGRADLRKVLLTGFGTENPQRGVNNPVYGLDNWIYFAHGDPDTELSWTDGVPGPDVRGRNLRVRFDEKRVEPTAVRSQFGHTFDAWGRHFLATNADHLYREAIAARYLERNPALLIPSAADQLPDHGAAAEIFPITDDPEYQLFTDVGVITSACGITCYLGGAFPEVFDGAMLVAEPSHNLVHMDLLESDGSGFVGRRLYTDREFMASGDSWFRPVNAYVGPDAALYILDYYRGIIEQPKFLTKDVMASGRLYAGEDAGRIYRITPREGLRADWIGSLRLSAATVDELVGELASPNLWRRRTAQRLLVQREDTSARASLERLVYDSNVPEARLHALWTLEGLASLRKEVIVRALDDASPGVRENAIRLAELHLDNTPELAQHLEKMGDDADPHVQYQLLLTLGYINTRAAGQVRDALLFGNVEDEWMQAAALSAPSASPRTLFDAARRHIGSRETEGRRQLFEKLGAMAAAAGQGHILLRASLSGGNAWWRSAVLRGLAKGARRAGGATLRTERGAVLTAFHEAEEDDFRSAAVDLLAVIGLPERPERHAVMRRVTTLAMDSAQSAAARSDAIRLLRLDDPASHSKVFERALQPSEPLRVQRAALDGLREVHGPAVGSLLIERWSQLTPELRAEALGIIMREDARIRRLLEAVESGNIQPASFEWTRRKRLMMHADPEIRVRARRLLAPEEARDLAGTYRAALEMDGDPAAGAETFRQLCSACHQVGGAGGTAFGPDLATIRSRRPEFIITDIIAPGQEIVTGYEKWTVQMNDGETVSGLVAEESPTSITLRQLGRDDRTISRSDVASMETTDASAMPGGFEQQLDQQQMADLLAFLKRPGEARQR